MDGLSTVSKKILESGEVFAPNQCPVSLKKKAFNISLVGLSRCLVHASSHETNGLVFLISLYMSSLCTRNAR